MIIVDKVNSCHFYANFAYWLRLLEINIISMSKNLFSVKSLIVAMCQAVAEGKW